MSTQFVTYDQFKLNQVIQQKKEQVLKETPSKEDETKLSPSELETLFSCFNSDMHHSQPLSLNWPQLVMRILWCCGRETGLHDISLKEDLLSGILGLESDSTEGRKKQAKFLEFTMNYVLTEQSKEKKKHAERCLEAENVDALAKIMAEEGGSISHCLEYLDNYTTFHSFAIASTDSVFHLSVLQALCQHWHRISVEPPSKIHQDLIQHPLFFLLVHLHQLYFVDQDELNVRFHLSNEMKTSLTESVGALRRELSQHHFYLLLMMYLNEEKIVFGKTLSLFEDMIDCYKRYSFNSSKTITVLLLRVFIKLFNETAIASPSQYRQCEYYFEYFFNLGIILNADTILLILAIIKQAVAISQIFSCDCRLTKIHSLILVHAPPSAPPLIENKSRNHPTNSHPLPPIKPEGEGVPSKVKITPGNWQPIHRNPTSLHEIPMRKPLVNSKKGAFLDDLNPQRYDNAKTRVDNNNQTILSRISNYIRKPSNHSKSVNEPEKAHTNKLLPFELPFIPPPQPSTVLLRRSKSEIYRNGERIIANTKK